MYLVQAHAECLFLSITVWDSFLRFRLCSGAAMIVKVEPTVSEFFSRTPNCTLVERIALQC